MVLSAGQAFKVSTITFQCAANDLQAICMMDAMPAFAMTAPTVHLSWIWPMFINLYYNKQIEISKIKKGTKD